MNFFEIYVTLINANPVILGGLFPKGKSSIRLLFLVYYCKYVGMWLPVLNRKKRQEIMNTEVYLQVFIYQN